MYIVSLNYSKPLSEIDRFIPEHIEYLKAQYLKGVFLLSGPKSPRTGGVILARTKSRSELDEIIELDPFYREGLADYEVTEIFPNRSSQELSHLLES